ncbi:glycosyltransferase [Alteribacter lacisalsi]|uniref:Glycosyltransferase n=1 Tax=Alteribacter lacisalsi TaxID=2045244 RepID=A0A2W0HTM4_9BACI|nr:glycosyltransferase family 2 protein [Alteribacter lacisalsi]PYZ96948.1 glycosyltransferase [Alteribacter lacisalsi]
MNKTLTVFTPTYNRAFCLDQLYESLIRQPSREFIWLIIDDGSTDHTTDLVNSWIDEGKIEIRYFYQTNQGMHGAHNTAYELIDTELNVCIDSDDLMAEGAVEKILSFWSEKGSDRVSGIAGLDLDLKGNVIGSKLPENISRSTLFDLYHRHGVTGDKKLVYRTDLTKKYPYPLFHGERYVGLAYKYYKLDEDYELLLLNEPLCVVEYLEDGSSMNMFRQYYRNPKGFSFYRKELMKLPFVDLKFKFRQAIHYVSSSMLEKNTRFLFETPTPLLTVLAIPPGLVLYAHILTKQRTASSP